MLWRAPNAVHFELGSHAVVVEGLPSVVVRRVASPGAPAGPAPELDEDTRYALTALTEAGFLWPRASEEDDWRDAPAHPRLAGELAALAVQHGQRAPDVLAARRRAQVEVQGRSRVAVHLAAVLAAAGVGKVHCAGDGVARLFHATPGGVAVRDEGTVLAAAAAAAIHRAAPEADTTPLPVGERPSLTILAVDGPLPDERFSALHAVDAPYLLVTLGLDAGVVGPLVLPGLTSCPRCADLHRNDRDPAWSALAVQLAVGRRYGPAAAVAAATVVAGVAAQQALAFLDTGESACLDGTLELRLPDWRLRRRSWPVHPECVCAGNDVPP
jgi:hypothetical protein